MRHLRFLFMITIFVISHIMVGAQYLFRLVDTTVGLPDNEVKALFWTPDGMLGVRTSSSLSLYDGCTFRSFAPNGDEGYASDYVSALTTAYVDSQERVWMKELNHILVFDLKKESYVRDVRALLADMGVGERVSNMFVDSAKNFWFVTSSGKLLNVACRAGDKRAVCRNVKARTHGLRDVAIWSGCVWLVYDDGWVLGLDSRTMREVSRQRLWTQPVQNRDFIELRADNSRMWLMWNHGVASLGSRQGKWQQRYSDNGHVCVTMMPVGDGSAYVGVRRAGLVHMSAHGSVSTTGEFFTTSGETISDDIQAIACNKKNLILGLYGKGICLYHPNMQRFTFMPFSRMKASLSDYRVSDASDGRVLLASANGVYRYDAPTMTLNRLPIGGSDFIRAFEDSRHRIWAGTFRQGIYMKDGSLTRHFMQGGQAAKDVNYDIVRGFVEDRNHRIWVNYHGGIGWFDERTQRIVPIRDKRIEQCRVVNDFRIDRANRLWVASGNGLYVYDQKSRHIIFPCDIVGDKDVLPRLDGPCKVLLIDSRGLVWIGTFNGVYVIDPVRRSVRHFDNAYGMSNEMINGIIEDHLGNVWVTTPNSLCRFQPNGAGEWRLLVFDQQNKLGDCRFGWMTVGHGAHGELLFGVPGGLYVVNPAMVSVVAYSGHPVFTALQVNGHDIQPGREYDGRVILPEALSATQRLVLSYRDNFVTVMFSGLNFDMPSHTYYRYRLRGMNDRWIDTNPKDGVGRAVFTDLAPGKYQLEVLTAGFDKQWSNEPARMEIVVEPPIWATWWARLLYMAAVVALIWYVVRWKIDQNRQRMEEEKHRELDDMKYRFFTNISHEFRTLLTLIITPIGSIMRRTSDEVTRSQLSAVSKNAGDLLQLVNQLLDFRKMEMNGERLCLAGGNVDEFVEYTTMKFRPLSEQKGISLKFENNVRGLFMMFDRDKATRIINNLLSNAFKYTEAGGTVTVALSKTIKNSRRYLRIDVSDTGCGISEADRKHLFERFFRSEHQGASNVGSGIGLNMVAEYVHMHDGRIGVESQLGKGSCFTVLLPTDLKNEVAAEQEDDAANIQTLTEASRQRPRQANADCSSTKTKSATVLVVEDNGEFRSFMVGELSNIFNKVLAARDGIEGALLAEENIPDIIVSDVMMPRMNGTDLCHRVKENIQTSHIPVILLTAWSTDEARKEGYRAGADAYIAKPFDMEMLVVRINNLLDKQEKRQHDFSHNLSLDVKTVANSAQDEEFLQQVITCIEKNISNSEYTIDSLARDVLMSRMSLYRKMKSLTGQTPADFIRTIRLKSAAKLLKSGKCNVSEACWQAGFASPQNFAKHFKEMFGVLPSQYQ